MSEVVSPHLQILIAQSRRYAALCNMLSTAPSQGVSSGQVERLLAVAITGGMDRSGMVGDAGSRTAGRPSSFMDLIYKICRSTTAALIVALRTRSASSIFRLCLRQSIGSFNGSGRRSVAILIPTQKTTPMTTTSHSSQCQIGSSHSSLRKTGWQIVLSDPEGEHETLIL